MTPKTRTAMIALLKAKETLRQIVQRQVSDKFRELEGVLNQIASEYNEQLKETNAMVTIEHPTNRILKLVIDDDTLVFALQTSTFQFDRDHDVWQTGYVTENAANAFVGVINVYDFLTESFKYDRVEDLGYLVARIFVNQEGMFFVEGKRQRNHGVKQYGTKKLDRGVLQAIVETAIKYSVEEFNALVPPYDLVKVNNIANMKLEIEQSKTKGGKRMGYQFCTDDVK